MTECSNCGEEYQEMRSSDGRDQYKCDNCGRRVSVDPDDRSDVKVLKEGNSTEDEEPDDEEEDVDTEEDSDDEDDTNEDKSPETQTKAQTGAVTTGLVPLKILNPRERGLLERWGKYNRYAKPGINWLIPFADRIRYVDITEQMVEIRNQRVISKDKLNLRVTMQIWFQIRDNETDVKASQYAVFDAQSQIVNIAKTTLRNIFGNMTFDQANSQRDAINKRLAAALSSKAKAWGYTIVMVELKELDPPPSVQKSMNRIIKAENLQIAAVKLAEAKKAEASGQKMAIIQVAEGNKQQEILIAEGFRQKEILDAEGKAKATKLVAEAIAYKTKVESEAAAKYFKNGAVTQKQLSTMQSALQKNAKFIITDGKSQLINMLGNMSGVVPLPLPSEAEKKSEKHDKNVEEAM